MEPDEVVVLMSALAQPTRLKVVALLSEHGPDGLPASELADLAGTPRNTMSGHLAILSNAGLVQSSRSGRNITYRVKSDVVADLSRLLGDMSSRRGAASSSR